jgi:hypothetical protein
VEVRRRGVAGHAGAPDGLAATHGLADRHRDLREVHVGAGHVLGVGEHDRPAAPPPLGGDDDRAVGRREDRRPGRRAEVEAGVAGAVGREDREGEDRRRARRSPGAAGEREEKEEAGAAPHPATA